jgi:hypothetical protein
VLEVLRIAASLQLPDGFPMSSSLIFKAVRDYLQFNPGAFTADDEDDAQRLFDALRKFASNRGSAPIVFELIEWLLSRGDELITAENYIHIIMLLNDFARQGSMGARHEQKMDQTAGMRRSRSPSRTELP